MPIDAVTATIVPPSEISVDSRRARMRSATLDVFSMSISGRRTQNSSPPYRPGTSYTRQLLDAGPERCAKKFGEEAVETVIAGVGNDPQQLKAEAADTLYHLLVLLESHRIALADVMAILEGRMGTSGIDEKASRKGSGP